MIECDICKDWFHGSCVQVEEHHAVDIDLYHCPNCAVSHGPSLMKKRRNWHRHDYTEPSDGTKPVQAGTRVFIRQLQARSFPSGDEVVHKMHGSQLTQRYLEKHGFSAPIMVPKLDGLGLSLPPSTFSVKDVEHYVGRDKVIDVIDVARQADSKMKLHNFIEYYSKPERPKVLNVISLEFSDTKMAELVEVPEIAHKLSWVENYWPDDSVFPKPFVQKYCLMGVKDSYTDFHIDFGGTSVWYHVLWGEKIFYLIKPTPENLARYESWSSSVNQSEVFFGDQVDKCFKCVVRQGHTLFVPTGWIHAVLTSQDCMAFGGNFLHNLNIDMQLRCYEMEKRLKTPDLFKFPYFEAICWFVAKNLLETLKELREDDCQPQVYIVVFQEFKHVAVYNVQQKEVVAEHAFEIPDIIKPGHLIKELTKEIRYLEEEGGSKPVKSQGIISMCPITRSSLDRNSSHYSKRKAKKLRDLSSKTPSNLDILELHTREVLKRLEMSPWEEDILCNSRLNGKFNKVLQPSTTVPEQRNCDLRLLLSNGKIIRDERQPLTNQKLSTTDTACKDNRRRMKVKSIKREQESSGTEEEEERPEIQKPLNMFFESVKSELRNGASEHSDISDSDESEHNCTTQQRDSSTEESDSSEDDERKGVTSDPKRKETGSIMDLYRASQKLCKIDLPVQRERPTSQSTEEEAIQGMLSMAGVHYTSFLPNQSKSINSTDKRTLLGEHWNSPKKREEGRFHQSHSASEYGCHVKEEHISEDNGLGNSTWAGLPAVASRLTQQDPVKVQKYSRKEGSAEVCQKIQENKNFMDRDADGDISWTRPSTPGGRCEQESSPLRDDCRRREGSLSPHMLYMDTSLSPSPLHPTKRPASNPPPISNQATKGKRPKKGMATAKQRLGKILKLNRHNHARFFV
uniref:Lysine demethylase 7A n=1 Tax=Latimeria chalumnae TaxID=7897 RepID=H3BFG4_LATCH